MSKPDITKPFWLFSGNTYYACGGFNDFECSYAGAEEALQARETFVKDNPFTWAHVVDIRTGEFLIEDGGQC